MKTTYSCIVLTGCMIGGRPYGPGQRLELAAVDAADLLCSGRGELCNASERAELSDAVRAANVSALRRANHHRDTTGSPSPWRRLF